MAQKRQADPDAAAKELRGKAEAVLFSTGKPIAQAEIARLCRVVDESQLVSVLKQLQKEYDERDSATMIVQDGPNWKMTVRERFMPIAKRIVVDTELPRSVIETLAVVAYKQPIKQSDVIKIRSNKGYDHLNQLEELGFLTRQKSGRTNLIKLTEKFFNYFELSSGKDIREIFKSIKEHGEVQKKATDFEGETKQVPAQPEKEQVTEEEKDTQEEKKTKDPPVLSADEELDDIAQDAPAEDEKKHDNGDDAEEEK